MSDTNELDDLWVPPKSKVPVLAASEENITDFWNLFVNRRAYTRQSDRPSKVSGRFFYYPPKASRAKDAPRLQLDWSAVRRHLAGWQTIGLYAIQPETQKSKWVAIDADYERAHYDLKNLKEELREDGVHALEEASRRGGHLWILCQEPVPARECKIYIYNLALRLGVPIKRSANEEGIEVFPRQEELAPGKFGNQIRGPLGVHRATLRRYWFYGADPTLDTQLAFLKSVKKLTPDELHRFTLGMKLPEEFARQPVEVKANHQPSGNEFRILDYVTVTSRESSDYRAQCPSCGPKNDPKAHHLAISIAEPWKYRCWYQCTKEMIRAAVGRPIPEERGNVHVSQRL
jgi:hypothetical protein